MGFWHTGYIEFHEFTGLGNGNSYSPSPVRYICELCSQIFDEQEKLRRHRFEQHPLRQPAIFLYGRVLGALPVQLMTPLQVQDVIVEDATHCTVNGQVIELDKLSAHLVSMRREYVELVLSNDGATTRCVLDFRIAEDAHLTGVEQAFARMKHKHVLNLDAVSCFIKDCRPFDSATAYYDGVCHYLYGVMAKECALDSGLTSDQYAERYLRASEALVGFERPLARGIRALVAFHFNHFHDAEQLASESLLRNTAGAFACLLQGQQCPYDAACSATPSGVIGDLIDQDTLQVLDDASQGLMSHTDNLLAKASRMGNGYDRLKYQLLAGEALSAQNDDAARAKARKLARELAGQEATRTWATALLERTRTP
jgi:hypothetical protein